MATDLDGTFWGATFVPPPSHVVAVNELVNAEVTVLVATSRRPRHVRPRLARAGLVLPAVLIDGSLGVDFRTDERFHQACFGPEAALATLDTFWAHGLDPCVYVEHPEFDIMVSETPSTCAEHLAKVRADTTTGDLVVTAGTSEVYAFSVLGVSRERLAPVCEELNRTNGSHAILYDEPVYGQCGLIANPPGVSKWTGIEAYCRLHGITAGEVMAVGDGVNDIPMLQRAGVAVGVRGGAPEAVALADHVIEPPAASGWSRIIDLLDRY